MEPQTLSVVHSLVAEDVRCLECGAVYSKPTGRGTIRTNPGCPDCGYLGWLSISMPVSSELLRRRFFLGHRRLPLAQSG